MKVGGVGGDSSVQKTTFSNLTNPNKDNIVYGEGCKGSSGSNQNSPNPIISQSANKLCLTENA